MRKLLSADLARLRKARIFWLGILFMFGLGIFAVCTKYSDAIRFGEHERLDDALLVYVPFIGCCAAAFCSIFFGTEYSDGTIRNKLIVGHTREAIYYAGWIAGVLAAVLMALAYLLAYGVLGSFLLEAPQIPVKMLFLYMGISIFTIIAYVSMFHMLSMLITRKSTAAVVCLLVFFGMLILAMVIKSKLDAPEFLSAYIMGVEGTEQTAPEPNPKYLQPAVRKVYQFFLDVLPTGQSIQLSAFEVLHPLWLVIYSAVVSAAATLIGMVAFRKKNLQ